jgi:hypothetical protein
MVIILDNEIDSTVQCRENLNSSPSECMLEVTDASFKHIDDVLQFVSKILDDHSFQVDASREPEIYKALRSRTIKAMMLSALITKSAEEFISPGILKVLLECVTAQTLFQKGDSMIIEVLPDNTLRISGEHPKGDK